MDRPARTYRFPRRMRLARQEDFRAAYQARVNRRAGPLAVYLRGNGLDHARLGISIPRRVGRAVVRNLIRRRVREAFRHLRLTLGAGYDVVINVRPHEPLPQDEYERLLADALPALERTWTRRTENGR
ncbi:MAG: ribonuclease P protein component [Planctomycetes bacterium]|nr:ribonuclease P protein component [Planctomycetota bacterium]